MELQKTKARGMVGMNYDMAKSMGYHLVAVKFMQGRQIIKSYPPSCAPTVNDRYDLHTEMRTNSSIVMLERPTT
jgi:hypothetical protein